jgi:hypothetical protein
MSVPRKCRWCHGWFAYHPRNDPKRGRFCSKRCTALHQARTAPHLTTEARRKGAARSAEVRRAAALLELADLTPVEIYRRGYVAGWHRGVRYARGVPKAQRQDVA